MLVVLVQVGSDGQSVLPLPRLHDGHEVDMTIVGGNSENGGDGGGDGVATTGQILQAWHYADVIDDVM